MQDTLSEGVIYPPQDWIGMITEHIGLTGHRIIEAKRFHVSTQSETVVKEIV